MVDFPANHVTDYRKIIPMKIPVFVASIHHEIGFLSHYTSICFMVQSLFITIKCHVFHHSSWWNPRFSWLHDVKCIEISSIFHGEVPLRFIQKPASASTPVQEGPHRGAPGVDAALRAGHRRHGDLRHRGCHDADARVPRLAYEEIMLIGYHPRLDF